MIEQEVQSIKKERLESIDELNQIYAGYILTYCIKNSNDYVHSNNFNFKIDKDTFSFDTLSDNLEKIVDANTFQISAGYWTSFKFSDIEKQLNIQSSYKERLSTIHKKQNAETLKLENEISTLEQQINSLNNLLLKDLIDNDSFIRPSHTSDLLWFCIKNGYIDETYQDYISYFFESSITRNDKNFARIVSSQNNPDFDIKLNKISDLLNYYIDSEQLLSDSGLNFSLMDYLLTQDDFNQHKTHLCQHLVSGNRLVNE